MPKGIVVDKNGLVVDAAETAANPAASAAAAARAEVFNALHEEMAIADYAVGESGHRVRRVPRNQRPERADKRKAMEKADMMEMAIEADDEEDEEGTAASRDGGYAKKKRKRLRGTKVAFDDVLLKSMPLANNAKKIEASSSKTVTFETSEDGDDGTLAEDQHERYEILQEVATLGIELGADEVFEEDDAEDRTRGDKTETDGKEDSGSECDQSKDDQNDKKSKKKSKNISQTNVAVMSNGLVKPKISKRLMHRLREFSSERLALKHGEAIGAHIRGMSETAVQKLREVAKAAPGAPQVYSSLGMVFESMLTEIEGGDTDKTGEKSRLDLLLRRLELSQKTYASYHVASLLCKRDFVLWERSGDAASKTSHIFSEIIDYMAKEPLIDSANPSENTKIRRGFDLTAGPEKWNSDRQMWVEHALSAYQSSDNLRPSGVDIPCKLAQMHIGLGNYIEALSILTDLRNKVSGKSLGGGNEHDEIRRSAMEGSYPCWLLYADLMIRIGYEFKIWNEGTSKSDKYMYKRWLRKHSKDFDWKERRVQALCLALEAAAGTASCTKLVTWMRERAEKNVDSKEQEDEDIENDHYDDDNANKAKENENNYTKKDGSTKKDHSASEPTYEEERENLLFTNKVALKKFDRMTKEMNLVAGSHIFKNRIAARVALLDKHRAAVKDLAMGKYAKEQQNTQTNPEISESEQPDRSKNELPPKDLPLQGSFATVYDIAALLLTQCIELKLFDGGLLAVQSVLNYSKARVSRHERQKVELQRRNELLQNKGQGLVASGLKYDQISFESDDSDEEGLDTYISDDEDLDQTAALQSLKNGRLPMDITAMHAICLLGAGGQDYLALNHVEQVIMSNELDLFGTSKQDTSIARDHQWETFSNSFKAPINKSSLLASIADLVTENASYHMRGIFRKYLNVIDSGHGRKQGLDDALSSPNELDRANTLKIFLAALKLMVHCARVDLTTLDEPGTDRVKSIEKSTADSIFALMMMLRFQHILWTPCHSDWSLPQSSTDMISILSGCLSILHMIKASSFSQDESLLNSVQVGSMKARHLISTICHADSAPWKYSTSVPVEAWRSFPLPSNWQNGFHEAISLRAYNLCVSCCVSSFSGWEPNEFNLDQLRSSDEVNLFLVSLEGPSSAGFLPKNLASVVAEQWEHIQAILPELEVLPFELHHEERRKKGWYQKAMRNVGIDSKISLYGEEDGIKALLSFSALCLIAAEESEDDEKDEFVKLSMSILLPLTQFSIDKQVWQSTIGTSVISSRNETKVGYYLDENCNWLGPTKTKEGTIQITNKPQRSLQPSKVTRAPRRDVRLTNVVKVPTSVLMEEWRKDDAHVFAETRVAPKEVHLAMKKVDDTMKNLRSTKSLNSLERASIDVSVALLSLATYVECNNPFVCLQQAAMFAAMGSKRGNNGEPFKTFLPLKDKCSPLEALNVLGRADCLRAINFLQEAQFLCTWVASVCRLHRDRQEEVLSWDSCWRVVGIVTYIVSATIDETGEVLTQDNPNAGLRKWEDTAKDEFYRGKSDARVLIKENSNQARNIIYEPAEEETLPGVERSPEKEVPLIDDPGVIRQIGGHHELDYSKKAEQNSNHKIRDHHKSNYPKNTEQNSIHQIGDYHETNYSKNTKQSSIDQIGDQHEFNEPNNEQDLFQLALDESVADLGVDNGEDYDPYAGVEVVGI